MKNPLNRSELNSAKSIFASFSQIKFRLLLGFACFALLSAWKCEGEKDPKEEELTTGIYEGGAIVLKGNLSRPMSVNFSTVGNPVKGTFSLGSGSDLVTGNMTGSALGLIYNITLSSVPAGENYTMSVTSGTKKLKGTMQGSPKGILTDYTVELKKK